MRHLGQSIRSVFGLLVMALICTAPSPSKVATKDDVFWVKSGTGKGGCTGFSTGDQVRI